jgi:hypothetical protein
MAEEQTSADGKRPTLPQNTDITISELAETVRFLLALQEMSLLIAIRQAYLLERVANVVYRLDDDEPISGTQVESSFKEIRDLFDEQLKIMKGEGSGNSDR